MKTKFISVLQNKFLCLALFSLFVFSACKKENVTNNNIPTSALMAYNLIPDSIPPLAFVLNNYSITNLPLSFNNYTGLYLSVASGPGTLQLYKSSADSAIATVQYTFEPEKYYSAIAMGANNNYKYLIVDDKLDSLPTSTGNAFVRYVNAIPDSSSEMFNISADETKNINGSTSFGDVSEFTGIAPGDITVSLTNDSTISANKTITLEKNKVYTILMTGIPHSTDTATQVKIDYIVNGGINP